MFFRLQVCLVLVAQFLFTAGLAVVQRNNNGTADGFISISNGDFQLNGRFFRFYGTNAYWAQMMTDIDLDNTFHDIATAGYKVVRTWAFNDVPSQPKSGTYFQILSGGKATINTGPDGLQRLDKVVAAATKYGVKLILTLTNNWNPQRQLPDTAWNRRDNTGVLPRAFLSNDYGGIDMYVRNFHAGGTHDLFYNDSTIISAFKNYIDCVVPRYASNPTVLAWELGNDLRCSSTVSASSSCKPSTITSWAAEISAFIKKLAPKQLVTTGDGGFYCLSCPKLYAKTSTQPAPALVGASFDGTYGIDTEDLISIPSIDFGSFQIFPEQTELFPKSNVDFAVKAIGDGGKWVDVHSRTSVLFKKPEALLASGIVTKNNWKFFVPNTASAPAPDGTPCQGVEDFQQVYAATAWAAAAINGKVDGVLDYQWVQNGVTSHGTTNTIWDKRDLQETSPNDGYGNYNGAANGQTAQQFAASLPPI